jgi:hypothetical protein
MRGVFRSAALIGVGLTVAGEVGPAIAADDPWQSVVNVEARYMSWHSSGGNAGLPIGVGMGGGSGQQLYLPVALQSTGRLAQDLKVEFLIRGGEIWTRQRTPTGSVEFSLPTDTVAGTTLTYLGWAGIQPFLSVNLNIPTGQSIIKGTSSNTKVDADLVPTPVFGEGLNVGTTIGVNVPIHESLIVSLGAGYTDRGSYDRTGIFGPITTTPGTVTYDPGDVFTFNGSIGFRGERGSVQFSAAYSIESATLVNDKSFYQAGDRIVLSAKAGYAWTDNWASRLGVSYSHMGKDLIAQASGPGLVVESANSNGDVYRLSLDTTYSKDNYSIGPTASLLFLMRNGYEATAPEFTPQRTGWSAGLVGYYQLSPQFSVNARAEYLHVKQGDNPTDIGPSNNPIPGTEIPPVLTTGWLGSIAGVIRF